MHFRKKPVIAAIIAISMIAAFLIPGHTISAEEGQDSTVVIQARGFWHNPDYIENYSAVQPAAVFQPLEATPPVSVSNMNDFHIALRDALVYRQTNIEIIYTGDLSDLGYFDSANEFQAEGVANLTNAVMQEDDYLRFNIMTNIITFGLNGAVGNIHITFPVTYLTTLEQENQIDTEVTRILTTILEPGMNSHQIVKAVHDYIVLNVTYDKELKEHSAYAGLFGEKKTVCQGYSLLAYKMLNEAGLGTRIISGMADSGSGPGGHAWNRVLLEGKWYNLDCTWDDLDDPESPDRIIYSYFNLNDTEIGTDHSAAPEYSALPSAGESYTTTLENLIAANPENEIYPRLQQSLGFDLLLSANTVENAAGLESKWLLAAQNKNSYFQVRYNNNSNDLNDAMLNEMFYRIADKSYLNGYSLNYNDINRGAAIGYLRLDFALTYFGTSNHPPTADPVSIDGSAKVGQTLSGVYSYADDDIPSDIEGLSQYQWYRSDKAGGINFDGSPKTAIPGAIGSEYTVTVRDAGKYLFFEVVPVAQTGTLQGSCVISAPTPPVAPLVEKVAQPTSNEAAGEVEKGTKVSLSTDTPDASIYYTLDGSIPTQESAILYDDESPIIIDDDTTIKAIAVKEGMLPSEVAVFAYTITGTDECFIATAAFGSKFDWPVALLRAFRDQYLLTNPIGTAFVDFYYQNSPPLAAFIAASEPLKILVRVLLAPIIAVVYMIYHPALLVIFLLGAATAGFFLRFRRKPRLV